MFQIPKPATSWSAGSFLNICLEIALTPPFNFAELKGFPQKDVISDIFMKIGKEDDKKQLISILKHVLIVKLS